MFTDDEIILFDLETTDSEKAYSENTSVEIIEIGALKVNRELEVLGEFNQLVCPSDLAGVTETIQEITRISANMLEGKPSFEEAWREFAKFTKWRLLRMCSWCVWTDYKTLFDEYRKLELTYPHSALLLDAQTIVYTLVENLGFYPRGWGLTSICKRLGVDTSNRHRALSDCYMLKEVLGHLRGKEEDERIWDIRAF